MKTFSHFYSKSLLTFGSVLLLAMSASAAEVARFPERFLSEKAEAPLRAYMKSSEVALAALDALAKSGSGVTPEAPRFKGIAIKQLAVLADNEKRALAIHTKETRKTLLPAAIRMWTLHEKNAWLNIRNIGGELMDTHDEILKATEDITNIHLPKLQAEKKFIAEMCSNLEKGMFEVAGAVGIAGTNKETLDMIREALKDYSLLATAITNATVKVEKTVVDFDARIKNSNYVGKAAVIFRKRIDYNQSGVFYEHEKQWEKAIAERLQVYKEIYGLYQAEAKPILTDTLLSAYKRVPNLPGPVRSLLQRVQKQLNEFLKDENQELLESKPQVEIDRLSFPTSVPPDKTITVEVIIENIGERPLAAKELTLIGTIDKSPNSIVRAGGVVFKDVNAKILMPRQKETFSFAWKTPTFVGNWAYEWELKYKNVTLDKHVNNVTVNGAKNAKITAVRFLDDIEAGQTVDVEIKIENTGPATLEAGDVTIVGVYKKAPPGVRANRNDFFFEIKSNTLLIPGRDIPIKTRFKVPLGTGRWELNYQLEIGGRVVDKTDVKVEVEP